MFTLWGKILKENKILKDITITDDSNRTRTQKVFKALEEMCLQLDLNSPIWLDKNVKDFKKFSRTRFNQDSYINEIDYDYFEIQIIEE